MSNATRVSSKAMSVLRETGYSLKRCHELACEYIDGLEEPFQPSFADFVAAKVKAAAKEVSYEDILDAIDVVCDYDPPDPLEDDDYNAHDRRYSYEHGEEKSRAFVDSGYRDRSFVIELRDEGEVFKYARACGASKQVAAEAEARNRQQRLDYIKRLYNGDVEYYGVCFEASEGGVCCFAKGIDTDDPNSPFYGAPDISESCWGCEGYKYANTEMREEIASQVVHQLEKAGWTVTGQPDERAAHRESLREHFRTHVRMFTWR